MITTKNINGNERVCIVLPEEFRKADMPLLLDAMHTLLATVSSSDETKEIVTANQMYMAFLLLKSLYHVPNL